ncbi:MAG: hypothetical protein IAB75_10140 [Bacteroidetes bacterium]|uniref:Uncharacterized protein n=1 Tax=Candidatus Cryptobacteroides avicola TaxID=2840757 RepID=A0A940IJB2_9BACT|nr:hypothetical protein [Candidatus Cryptobacteroides avicola]
MKKILILLVAALSIPALMAAQAQITTKKVKIEDFTEKVTKVVLSGNMFYDSTLKEAVREHWTISPYEFCSIEDFQEMKTDADYYFLIKVKGQFRKESGPGIEFLSLLKGGPEAEKGLDKMLELITFPYAAVDSPSGRETVFLPLMLNIVQQHVLSSIATDIVAYSPLIAYSNNIGKIKGKQVIMAEEDLSADVLQLEDDYLKAPIVVTDMDTADEYVAGNVADAVVSYTVCPEDPQPGAFCYKMLVNAEDGELYYFRKHRITRKTGPGFLVEDMNRIVEALD